MSLASPLLSLMLLPVMRVEASARLPVDPCMLADTVVLATVVSRVDFQGFELDLPSELKGRPTHITQFEVLRQAIGPPRTSIATVGIDFSSLTDTKPLSPAVGATYLVLFADDTPSMPLEFSQIYLLYYLPDTSVLPTDGELQAKWWDLCAPRYQLAVGQAADKHWRPPAPDAPTEDDVGAIMPGLYRQ